MHKDSSDKTNKNQINLPAAFEPHINVLDTLVLFVAVPERNRFLITITLAGRPPIPPSLPSSDSFVSSRFIILLFCASGNKIDPFSS